MTGSEERGEDRSVATPPMTACQDRVSMDQANADQMSMDQANADQASDQVSRSGKNGQASAAVHRAGVRP